MNRVSNSVCSQVSWHLCHESTLNCILPYIDIVIASQSYIQIGYKLIWLPTIRPCRFVVTLQMHDSKLKSPCSPHIFHLQTILQVVLLFNTPSLPTFLSQTFTYLFYFELKFRSLFFLLILFQQFLLILLLSLINFQFLTV